MTPKIVKKELKVAKIASNVPYADYKFITAQLLRFAQPSVK